MTGSEHHHAILSRVAVLLDSLGPFQAASTRGDRWRTTEQIAHQLGLHECDQLTLLDEILRQHEAEGLERMAQGLAPDRLIRRAKYPDRTTALPLWGSTRHHAQPWVGHRPDRADAPQDRSPAELVECDAPTVFLSHSADDAPVSLRLAESLAADGIRAWRFETSIEQRGDIAQCVRNAINEADSLVALVTRTSIASLWVLTELHTCLLGGKSVSLIVDATDEQLLKLLASVKFGQPDDDFDLRVKYDHVIAVQLQEDYALRQPTSRTERYLAQMRDFLATLPMYLGSKAAEDQRRVWKAALAFPDVPATWPKESFITLAPMQELKRRL